jgi:hypothetical protein
MKYGTTKTGKIHVFTDNNECICDLNIQIDKEVSREYIETRKITDLCFNCQSQLSESSNKELKAFRYSAFKG